MTPLIINIPDDLQPFVDRSVNTGSFKDASDFLINLIYTAKTEKETAIPKMDEFWFAALHSQIEVGIEQADCGEFVEFTAEDIIAAGRRNARLLPNK